MTIYEKIDNLLGSKIERQIPIENALKIMYDFMLKLQAENARYKKALDRIANDYGVESQIHNYCIEIAKQALDKDKKTHV